jgi:co-chaperonin GroES (HSP10)
MEDIMKDAPFTVHGTKLLVKPFPNKEETTSGGLILPGTTKLDANHGVIMHLGIGDKGQERDFHIGQEIIWEPFKGRTIKLDKVEYQIIDFKDIVISFKG